MPAQTEQTGLLVTGHPDTSTGGEGAPRHLERCLISPELWALRPPASQVLPKNPENRGDPAREEAPFSPGVDTAAPRWLQSEAVGLITPWYFQDKLIGIGSDSPLGPDHGHLSQELPK